MSLQVLHVDDDDNFLDMVSRLLETKYEDIEVISASNVEEALELLESRSFECIVCDYHLPSMDGLDFYSLLKEESHEVPFILYTGKGTENVSSRATFLGVSRYLEKGKQEVEKLGSEIRQVAEVHG